MRSRTSFTYYVVCAWPRWFVLIAVAMASCAAWLGYSSTAPLVVGGSIIGVAGVLLMANRLIRRGPGGVDDAIPPWTLPTDGPGVLFNEAAARADLERVREQFMVYDGIAYTIVGLALAARAGWPE